VFVDDPPKFTDQFSVAPACPPLEGQGEMPIRQISHIAKLVTC